MSVLRFVLGDQLTRGISSLDGVTADDVVLMVEVAEEATYVRHHKQKLVFVLSAMRHHARRLRDEGLQVRYVALGDAGNTGTFSGELQRAVAQHRPDRIVVTEPGEYRVLEMIRGWSALTDLPVEVRDDDRFLCSRGRFSRWARGRKSYRMEFFYREMRRETGYLMDGDAPEGGRWNYDAENRSSIPASVRSPERLRFAPDDITTQVIEEVHERFADHFGDLEPFGWAVDRDGALRALDHFIAACLPRFGDYQDAMRTGNPFLFHAMLSPYLNIGLLTAREVCDAVAAAYKAGHAPLNATEGFIRQILGWREYVRGLYWHEMPGYAATNELGADRPLPWFYWSGDTDMNCLATAIGDTRRHAYAHHIQRLMVTGNFALLAGVRPAEIEAWYLAVYVDAYDWVELPNTHGMVMFADGGRLASKPYAASGAYINRMSDACKSCRYRPTVRTGPRACPFHALYWAFLIRHRDRLGHNPRLAMPYRTLDRMGAAEQDRLGRRAEAFLDGLALGPEEATGGAGQLNLGL
jgi:deoxyribodipyrimidine photolyase-related protein